MKKSTYFLTFSICLALFLGILFVGCRKVENEDKTKYYIEVNYGGENTITAKEEVTYFNNTDNALSFLQFNLYANTFKDKDIVVTIAEEERAYYNGFSEGKIEILSVKTNEKELQYSFENDNLEILKVYLLNEIYPEEEQSISIEFVVTLANINHRLGKGENTVNLGNFYPILSVYENGKGFYNNTYQPFGDPFYSQVADYEVNLTCPKEFSVASSTQLLRQEDNVESKTLTFKGENIRDFALVLSLNFSSIKQNSQNCMVEYFGYAEDEDLEYCLEVAVNAVEYFSKSFGKYPYEKLSVVKNSFVQGGMEYSGLVMISDAIEKDSRAYVIVHEIAHQWWYGGVGNNQCETAWLDEGLTEYSTLMFFRDKQNYGVNFKECIESCIQSYKIYEKVQNKVYGNIDGVMDKRLDKFASSPDYVALSYTKSTLMFNCLEQQLGQKKFLSSLRDFYKGYIFKEASRADIIASFSASSHRDLEGLFSSWLDGKTVIA